MSWHPEILGRRQERVLAHIGRVFSRRGFYLAGGTAVALHLGHRRSVDFDWFTRERFDPLALAQELREEGIAFVTDSVATNTLHIWIWWRLTAANCFQNAPPSWPPAEAPT